MSPTNLRLGTRGSQLALFQANAAAALLLERTGTTCEIVVIKTSGDRLSEAPLTEIGGKRLFVKEIEDALLAGEIDLAVHSSKDMPAVLPTGLDVGAVLAREDARDAIVLPETQAESSAARSFEAVTARLGEAPRLGTSSVRRSAQLARLFPKAAFLPIRGNLDTRLRKLDSGSFDAIVLAAAGLKRLKHEDRISAALPVHACVPAPGQGIIAIEIRADDTRVRTVVASVEDSDAMAALDAERTVVTRLGGGCQMPLGAYATVTSGAIDVMAIVISPDGSRIVRASTSGARTNAREVGAAAAEQLLAGGASEILAEVERSLRSTPGLEP